jgi:hypothetical protein
MIKGIRNGELIAEEEPVAGDPIKRAEFWAQAWEDHVRPNRMRSIKDDRR